MEAALPRRAGESGGPPDEAAAGERALAEVRDFCLHLLAADYRRIPEGDREDLAQELTLDFWRRREAIRHPVAWAYVATRHRAVSWLRTRHLSEPPPREAGGPAATPAEAGEEVESAIRALFFTLESGCRRILARLYIGGWSIRRLAEATREDPRAISRRRARCLKALRARWIGAGGGAPGEDP